MTSRERTMAVALIALLLIGGGAVGGYMLVYSPLQDKNAEAQRLRDEVSDLETKMLGARKLAPQIAAVKRQSLPSDPVDPKDANKAQAASFNTAKAQYKLLLERLLHQAKIGSFKIPGERVVAGRPPVTPEVAPKKPAYTAIAFSVTIEKADIWQVVDFLRAYYQADLLHQITDLKITREGNKPTDPRNGLTVQFTSEALVLDGAEPRKSLFPASPAIAAVAGWRVAPALEATPGTAQHLTVTTTANLATRGRDYSLIPARDMFFGPVPPYVPPKPQPLAVAKIDSVTMTRDEKPQSVEVKVTGDGAAEAAISASVDGSLIPEGDLKFDPKTKTLTIPAIDKEASAYSTSTVTITAKSPNGTTAKTTFQVAAEPMPKLPPKDDISGAIRLVIVSTANDGSARAVIKDAANPFRYIINATAKGITIAREYQVNNKKWDEEGEYRRNNPPGLLIIADEETATRRTFRVVAIEHNALILSEQPVPEPAKLSELPGKGGGKGGGMGGMGGMGFRPQGNGPRQGPAAPISAVASNLAITSLPPVYYRWDNGKSLKNLVKLTPDETAKILRLVADTGPVVFTAVAGN